MPELPEVPVVPLVPVIPDVPELPEEPSPPEAPFKLTSQLLYVPPPTQVVAPPNTNTPVRGSYDVTIHS